MFIADCELLKRNIFKIWFDFKKAWVKRLFKFKKAFFHGSFQSSCIANKYLVFHRSVARKLYVVTEDFMSENYKCNFHKTVFHSFQGFSLRDWIVFPFVSWLVRKLQQLHRIYYTTTWQTGFKIYLYQCLQKCGKYFSWFSSVDINKSRNTWFLETCRNQVALHFLIQKQ